MKGALPDVEIQTNEGRSKEVDKYVVFLELKEAIDCEAVCKFIENNKISLENYMLRVSIVTEHEMGGILVPKFAIKLLCQLGCDLNFSFTKV